MAANRGYHMVAQPHPNQAPQQSYMQPSVVTSGAPTMQQQYMPRQQCKS